MALRIEKFQPGTFISIAFKNGASKVKEVETHELVGVSGSGPDRRVKFRSPLLLADERRLALGQHSSGLAPSYEWEAYRFSGRWAYGTSAEPLSFMESPAPYRVVGQGVVEFPTVRASSGAALIALEQPDGSWLLSADHDLVGTYVSLEVMRASVVDYEAVPQASPSSPSAFELRMLLDAYAIMNARHDAERLQLLNTWSAKLGAPEQDIKVVLGLP